jgi:hypothetical protein
MSATEINSRTFIAFLLWSPRAARATPIRRRSDQRSPRCGGVDHCNASVITMAARDVDEVGSRLHGSEAQSRDQSLASGLSFAATTTMSLWAATSSRSAGCAPQTSEADWDTYGSRRSVCPRFVAGRSA